MTSKKKIYFLNGKKGGFDAVIAIGGGSVIDAAKIGADVVTLPPAVLEKMMQPPLTKIGLENFLIDWEKLKDKNPDIKI